MQYQDLNQSTMQAMTPALFAPAITVVEDASKYTLIAELPGVSPDELDVAIQGVSVVIRGTRQPGESLQGKSVKLLQNERCFGCFERTVQLPLLVETSKIDAQIINGILTITLPKKGTEEFPYKKVSVTNGSSRETKVNVK